MLRKGDFPAKKQCNAKAMSYFQGDMQESCVAYARVPKGRAEDLYPNA